MARYTGEIFVELFLRQQNLVVLDKLKSALLGGANLNSATTIARVTTLGGTTLSNTTMTFASGSAGRYEGTFDAITSLVEGTEYLTKITVTSVGTTVAFWKIRSIAVNRRD